uniref:NADH-ubiquinone oxidoreductase chain 5 n=1 Tax=Platypus contaminatus TaxID=2066526 RepID=A0A6C0RU08_9CUCU|nr:NADH dehydrogenase subunit 5 [Platypus contaminatus]QIA44535.1 NADH dehydrogenase subunit 5 [Platypus contaminatus]
MSLSFTMFVMGVLFILFNKVIFIEFNILSLNSMSLVYSLLLDWMSFIFMSFVFIISGSVIMYSESYMESEKSLNRFIYLVLLFIISMMFLILSPNLVSILLGWDGLGLVSYALVIYYQNVKSFNAGMLTVLVNRVGDVALLMSISLMVSLGSWSFYFLNDLYKGEFFMILLSLFIVLAAFTKSAQMPFSSWLPAAMAAPTPVSALVHSSTLVTAGVYLLIRFSNLISLQIYYFILFISLFTMFMSGLGANVEFDLKKIIALSTLSQLGLMISVLILGDSSLAFFHLLTHALFKALLFMCAGVIIHSFGNFQDIRLMGGILNNFPFVFSSFMVCNFSLCGIPFMSGFYSKDLLAELYSMSYMNIFVYIIFFLSIGLTASYSFRLFYYVCMGDLKCLSLNSFMESFDKMVLGMKCLIFIVILSGSVLNWLIFPYPFYICLPFLMKMMTLFLVILGILIGVSIGQLSFSLIHYFLNLNMFYYFNFEMWNLVYFMSFVNIYFLNSGKKFYLKLDQGWFEYYGSQGIYNKLGNLSSWVQLFSLNHLIMYISLFFTFIFLIICIGI